MNRILTVPPEIQEKFRRDSQRPVYHFLPPMNWTNDPNGLIQWKGVYHLFYQHNPVAAKWGPMHWGHAVSRDLVHWEHRPIALEPTPGGPDEDGCWSGVAVNHNGVPTMIYSGNRQDQQRCCLAFSNDDLHTLVKYAHNPVVPDLPAGYDILQYRDHCVWYEAGQWQMLIGAGIRDVGGAVLLYRSPDLVDWTFAGPILTGDLDRSNPLWSGWMWECPDLIPLGAKHLLVISAYAPGEIGYTGCFLGMYRDGTFTPETYAKLDLGDREFYAPQSFLNEAGERIQFGWITDARSEEANLEAGWAGLISMPRLLSLRPEGKLGVCPHPAVRTLRRKEHDLAPQMVTGAVHELGGLGAALEIHAIIGAGASARCCGLKVFCSPDGREETTIAYEPGRKTLRVIRERSSLDGRSFTDARGGEVDLAEGEDLDLDIFLDHSVIEVFINGKQTLTCRAYPTQLDATGVRLFAEEGSAEFKTLKAWEMGLA